MAAVREVPQRVSKFHFSTRKTPDQANFGHPKFTASIFLGTEKVLVTLSSDAITENRFHLLLCWILRHFSSTCALFFRSCVTGFWSLVTRLQVPCPLRE
jgi:hypothetical protein